MCPNVSETLYMHFTCNKVFFIMLIQLTTRLALEHKSLFYRLNKKIEQNSAVFYFASAKTERQINMQLVRLKITSFLPGKTPVAFVYSLLRRYTAIH
ncbi:hypothetical protein GDO81_000574 [Engystomops pustulosus]|uniref:Uncharacterized protein n=1 Tax=Engystomops pustulosus TaxID=76066 RepID=A0AAV7D8R5_ENGPU|nr:hypothetical protein GDO81_000574 [Engystomops pustulosus]